MSSFLRHIDIATALAGLVLLAPVMLTIALVVRATSPGPAIVRIGTRLKDDSIVSIHQFRTCRVDATQESKFGRLLHKYSLHLLPAIVTVLHGRIRFRDFIDLNCP
jgi:polysaccharide biosynthesis protein PslA